MFNSDALYLLFINLLATAFLWGIWFGIAAICKSKKQKITATITMALLFIVKSSFDVLEYEAALGVCIGAIGILFIVLLIRKLMY